MKTKMVCKACGKTVKVKKPSLYTLRPHFNCKKDVGPKYLVEVK